MIQHRQDLALGAKPLHDIVQVHSAPNDFDGNLFLKLVISPCCAIDNSHSAARDLSFDAIGSDSAADFRHAQLLVTRIGSGGGECRAI
jgi:hypothetical protein